MRGATIKDHIKDVSDQFDDTTNFGDTEPPWRDCTIGLDMSTFDPRSGVAWTVETCTYRDANTGNVVRTSRRPVAARRPSKVEIAQWMAANT